MKIGKRLLSLVLCFVMLVGLMPTTAFAWTAPTLSGDGGGTWNIQLSAEGVLSWNDQSATSYTIEVDKTAMGSTLTRIENINATSYNLIDRFKELKVENGTYYFQIKANGPDTTSNTISFRYISPEPKLPAPLNLSWDGTTAKWDSVANATKYTVNLYTDDGYLQLSKTATETQYDWKTEATDGRWFEVIATANGYRDSNPAEGPKYGTYSWTAPHLSGNYTAWGVQLSDEGLLSWNEQQGATSYDIEVDKTAMGGTVTNIYSINTNAFNLINRFKELKLENGTYYFSIKANGLDTNSGTFSFKYVSPEPKLSAPQNLQWDGTIAKWDGVANATKYTVNLYSDSGYLQLSKTATEAQYDWGENIYRNGFWFEVVATAEGYRDSNATESPKYDGIASPTTYNIGAYAYDATVGTTGSGGQVYLTTDKGTDGWSTEGYIKHATGNTTVTLNANPATGYKFVEWRQGTAGAAISTEANYQFTASEDKYLYAVFEAISTTEYQIELQIFDITYEASAGGTVKLETNRGSAEGTNPKAYATEDTAVTITAIPAAGYEFVAWKKYTPHYSTTFSTDATYTFTATEEIVDVNENPPLFLYAVFQEVQQVVPKYEINCVAYNLSDSATAGTVYVETDMGGTGYAASQQKYATENTTVKLRAVAEEDYEFVAWRKGAPDDANATVSTNEEYEFTATEAVWMYAVFQHTPTCTIDCTVFDITGGINNGQIGVGGTVSIQTDIGSVEGATPLPIKATRNSSVTVNAVAAQGYEFLGWKKSSPYVQDFVATTASYTFDINEELYLYAVFQEAANVPTYTVTVTYGSGGGDYTEGANVTITANPPENGKQFKEWTGADSLTFTSGSKTTATATFTMPAEAVTVTATYEDIPQQPTEISTINITGIPTPTAGASPDVTGIATDTAGITLGTIQWQYGNGNVMNANNGDTFAAGTTYMLYVGYTVDSGYQKTQQVALTTPNFTPDNNGVEVNRTWIGIKYTIPAPQPTTYTVAVTNGSGSGDYTEGANVTITANAAPQGKVFDKWEVTGATVANVNSATTSFTMPANAVTATATYKDAPQQPTTYTVTVSANNVAYGTVTGGNTYNENASVTVTATPNNGYQFVKWTEGGQDVSTNASYTFTANANRALVAVFEAIPAQPTGHTHNYGQEPNKWDATHHWKQCGDPNCPDKENSVGDKAPHADSDGDGRCDDCDVDLIKISFAPGEGTGTMAAVYVTLLPGSVSYDFTLPANGFTAPSGKSFKCWSVGGSEKAVGAVITVADDTTVTAAWMGNTYNPRPNYPIYINPTPGSSSTGQIIAAKTFDGGIGLSVAVTILSAMGGAWLAKKKED